MRGRPRKTWGREQVLIWIVTRSHDRLDAAIRSAKYMRQPSAELMARVDLALATAYPRDRKAANAAPIAAAFAAAAKELELSGIKSNAAGLFDCGAVLKRWPAERRKWEKGHFSERAGTPSIKDYMRLVLTEKPLDWPAIRAALDLPESTFATPSQKESLNAAIRFAFLDARRCLAIEAIGLAKYRKRRGNILAWRRSRKGSIRLE